MYHSMARIDRLEHWASLLERSDVTRVTPFRDVELLPPATREALRTSNSPLDIAYRDPVLRRAGLSSDRYGDGASFFELSSRQAHRVLCSCGYFGPVRGTEVARRVRAIAARARLRQWAGEAVPSFARWLIPAGTPLAGHSG
ncbi:MAG: hypothetical protein JO001_04785 [Alphaproteobacteria bacterium]|nr:hypothetical protein [Alphaproteobacteria bacterium]